MLSPSVRGLYDCNHTCYWDLRQVEWKVHVEGNAYVLGEKAGDGSCKWPCPGGCPQNPGDNWLW